VLQALVIAVVLGLVEGITEFLPVSSTGHLIIVGRALGIEGARANSFEIFIQLGAILAVVWELRRPLLSHARASLRPGPSRRLLGGVAVAFLPAAALGLLFHHQIERWLFFDGPVAWAMIVGGGLILLVESRRLEPRTVALEQVSWGQAIAVGFAQVAALFPGFSRSAATILGGLLAGMSRPVATEFSFYLAIPTLGAASLYSLAKELPGLGAADVPFFAAGFLVSFLSAAVVVRSFLAYVRTRTFRPFAWYRIAFGALILALLLARG
jgi:undecaprenyl-diphosphatase